MAFKMKGNPYQTGKIATKSALEMKTSYKMKEAMAKMKKEDDSSMKKYKSDAQRKAVHASKAERGMTMKKEAPMKAAKPDYIDLDGDGNKTESMKKAAADKKSIAKMKKRVPKDMDQKKIKDKINKEVLKKQLRLEEAKRPSKKSAAKMKSPMEKGKTSIINKIKSAGKAIGDTMKQEIKNPAGHGTSDSFTHRLSRNYKARKKEARKTQ